LFSKHAHRMPMAVWSGCFRKVLKTPLWIRKQIIGGDVVQKACLGRDMHVETSSLNQCPWGGVPWRYT
jgi:hypothetical protein